MVPNIIHFIFGLEKKFGNRPFSIFHYLAIKSAYEINEPDKIYFYYKYEPQGYWWGKAKKYVEPILISVPRQIYGNKLYHYAHKSDVIRLMILFKYGGIYLDIDTICLRPFTNLLNNSCVMAKELLHNGEEHGLCNAVILAEKGSKFIQYWLSTYKHFRSKGKDIYWAEHSVRVPLKIAELYPNTLHIEPERSFFYPSYFQEDLKMLFQKNLSFPEAYVFHLWESLSFDSYLSKLTREYILAVDTSYNIIARNFL